MNATARIIAMVQREPKISLRLVAERVGCHPAYVRTALHRAGIFRRAHDPDVIYERSSGKYVRLSTDEYNRLIGSIESVARKVDGLATHNEIEASAYRPQARFIPEPQLSKLKAQHWRIVARYIRDEAQSIVGEITQRKED